jgi:hypothetical protein
MHCSPMRQLGAILVTSASPQADAWGHIVNKSCGQGTSLVSCPGYFDIEIFYVYPHAYAWRFRVDTEPPCVSMRVDASIAANWNRRDSLLAQAPRLTHGAMLSTNHVVKALV